MQRKFEIIRPGPDLEPYIERYWVLEFDQPELQMPYIKVLPYGHPEFVFHYGAPFQLYDHDRKQVPGSNLHALVGGQQKKHVYLQPTGKAGFFAIRFRPAGLYSLMGGSMSELAEQSLALEEVYGAGGRHLTSVVLEAVGTAERVEQAEQFFRRQLARRGDPVVYAHHAIRYVRERAGQVKVADLCRRLGIGERQVEREFKEKVGIGPKTFVRITRLDNIFKLLRSNPELSWAELAFDAGFADQAHLINEFRAFSGESPKQYFSNHAAFAEIYQGV
jgi:AraC-like DNA-binding protein